MTHHERDSTADSQKAFGRGHCLCNSVRYEARAPLRSIIYCHCEMCRRTGGHFVAATACERQHLDIQISNDALRWFQSSTVARRGFCQICGSNLFWDSDGSPNISIWAGTLDSPSGLVGREHIYTANAGDYYVIADGLPQYAGDSPRTT